MVLVHKLKQMEELDIEYLRNEEEKVPLGGDDETGLQNGVGRNAPLQRPVSKRAPSPPRRPVTRSQTGRVSKRRRRDESPLTEVTRKNTSSPRKKLRISHQFTDAGPTVVEVGDKAFPAPPSLEHSVVEAEDTSDNKSPLDTTQLTFLDGSPSSIDAHLDRRGPRSRVSLPVPVPNLTKKSRGRRVPTRSITEDDDSEQKETRLYVCKVESCGKCFHRGEHLKRHIRSIHTHEKPFKCSQPSCDKRFNRHDNLLQHLKVHKELATPCPSHTTEGEAPLRPRQRSHSLVHGAYESPVDQPSVPAFHQQTSFMIYPTADTPYGSTSEPTSFGTNMAISSLRTEIPPSPPVPRKHEVYAYSQHRTELGN